MSRDSFDHEAAVRDQVKDFAKVREEASSDTDRRERGRASRDPGSRYSANDQEDLVPI